MSRREPQHQRIRFRRDEIADLDALPSAREAGDRHPARRSHSWKPAARRLTAAVSIAVFLFFALAAGLYAVSASGFAQERMRAAAERAIERVVGRDMAVRIGATRISLDGTRLLVLEVGDFGLKAAGQAGEFAQASSLRFGVELLPLLSGHIVPTSASLSDARFDAAAFGAKPSDYLAALRDTRGLLDPDRLPPLVFAGLRRVLDALDDGGASSLELTNVSLAMPLGGRDRSFVIAAAEARTEEAGALRIDAQGFFDGRGWGLDGRATRGAEGSIGDLAMRLRVDAPGMEAAGDDTSAPTRVGALRMELSGKEGAPSRLSLAVDAPSLGFKIGAQPESRVAAAASLVASVTEGQGKVEIEGLRLASGATTLDLNGAVGPRPAELGDGEVYRYELVGEDLHVAASDSPEPPLRLKGSVSGTFDAQARVLTADRIAALTEGGSAAAKARLRFEPGRSPGIDFSLRTTGMPVAHAKQLWPWTAGRKARAWAQQHLRGGSLTEGEIEYHIAAGRMGDGVPATSDELTGRFALAGTSFDTAGALPPVSDASGTIAFRGTDADAALTAGKFALPSGRLLQAADTKLVFRGMTQPPLIAKLDGELTGDAAAAAELIALDPINAGSKLPFNPDDLSGTLVAHVTADIPLQPGIPRDSLDWLAIVDFKDLALSAPLDGQQLSGATGTLSAEPSSVQIEADAELNGVPAKLDVVEPLRPGGPERRRGIELTLDDKARDRIAPGLSTLVMGPASLKVDAAAPERKVSVDLAATRLDLPWIGWSKGAGVPATASFVLDKNGNATRIADLTISGQSFRVDGELALAGNAIQSARFGNVQLNRGDQVSVEVKRKGNGYAVTVRGKTFDGRALVKASTAAKGSAKPEGRSADVALDARIDEVTGFGGESLKGLSLAFSGAASARSLTASATTDRGAAVSMKDDAAAGRRTLAMSSADAGSVLRFFGIYPNMQGGSIEVALSSSGSGPLEGDVTARNFVLVNEPRLASLVSSKPKGADRSLSEAVKRDIDVSRVTFDRASATIEKGTDFLAVKDGILRGVAIGSTFQGTLYDAQGRMDMTGTFMPAYGLNRLFGELPLIGVILGNGNDRGLLGVTFKLEGDAKSPSVTVNPLSIIAPGIFRRIFEFGN